MELFGICPKMRYCRNGNRIYHCRPENGRHSTNLSSGPIQKIRCNLIPALPCLRFERTYPRPDLQKYHKNPKTIGDHIRKRRMDLGLSQSKLGRIFSVSKDCVTNWENGRNTPHISFYPRIISFLEYNPFLGDKTTLGNAIFAYRCENGMSAKSLGAAIGIRGCTVLAIEQNRCIPLKDTLRKIGSIIQYKL